MNPHFSEWYSLVDLDPDRETLERRWKGVISAAQARSTNKWLDYVRIYNGEDRKNIEYYDDFIGNFRDEDPKFPSSENVVEVRVLAGSTICKKFDRQSSNADILSIAILSSQLNTGDETILLPEVLTKASRYYRERSRNARRVEETGSEEQIEVGSIDLRRVNSLGNKWNNAKNELNDRINELIKYIEKNRSNTSQLLRYIERQNHHIKCLREETEVLWWLFGGRSKDTETPFKEVGIPGSTLQLGKELADLTEIVPGPKSAKGILRKATELITEDYDDVSIEEVLGSANEEWLREWIAEVEITERIVGLTPCISAANSFCQSHENWKTLYDNTPCLISPTLKLSPPNLSFQAYLECLLKREVT